MNLRAILTVGVAVGTLPACASTPASSEAPAPTAATAQVGAEPGPLRWSGTLRPMQQRSGSAIAPSAQNKAHGTVLLSVSPNSPNRTRAQITLSVPLQAATELRWAILSGRCGSASLPLAGFEQFPVLEMGSNGRGQLDAEIPMTLPTAGTYHVNVYWTGHQIADVLTCATLRREGSQ